jgi:recombination protein RecT
MSNLVVIKQAIADPRAAAQLKMALPEHIPVERFQRVALTALMNNPDIADCSKESVMNSLMKCAQDGLVPDNREAALVKFKNTAQYMPMVYGLIKRMRNSGEVQTVNAYIVYENDEFDYVIEDGIEKFMHRPRIKGDRGAMVLAYCVVLLKDGGKHIEVMSKADIDRARAASRAPNSPAWANWYEEMAKKTVIHRAAKRCPTSSEIEQMLQRDMRVILKGDDTEEEAPQPKSLVGGLNAAIEAEIVETETDSEPAASADACSTCGGKGVTEWTDGTESGTEPCPDCTKGN